MSQKLAGKTALVTAAAQGIGAACARAFAAAGARVIATDINQAGLAALETESIATRRLDVTDRAAIPALAEDIGAVDILLNCAGVVHHGALLDCSPEDWERAFALNVRAMYDMIRAFLPGMIAQHSGSIINMASVASSIKGVPQRCAYSATKAAVIGLTKSVAADYVADGVRCNAICPGTIDTPSLRQRIDAQPDPAAARRAFLTRQPMGRLGRPAEIAALAVWLASDDAGFVTGAQHVIDGGWTN
jgi:2-keto-3-deoxy-L-fuconate dehydrogenase